MFTLFLFLCFIPTATGFKMGIEIAHELEKIIRASNALPKSLDALSTVLFKFLRGMLLCLKCNVFTMFGIIATCTLLLHVVFVGGSVITLRILDSLKKDIAKNGGKSDAKVTDDTTHLVVTEKDYDGKSAKG